MYAKEELSHCNHLGMAYILTAYTQKYVKGILKSFWMFIDVLQLLQNGFALALIYLYWTHHLSPNSGALSFGLSSPC